MNRKDAIKEAYMCQNWWPNYVQEYEKAAWRETLDEAWAYVQDKYEATELISRTLPWGKLSENGEYWVAAIESCRRIVERINDNNKELCV